MRPLRERTAERLLTGVFLVLVGSFVVTTVIVERTSANVETISQTLVDKTMPDITHLATLRSSVLEVELALAEVLRATDDTALQANAALDARIAELDRAVRANRLSARLPGEEPYTNRIERELREFEAIVAGVRGLRGPPGLVRFQTEVLPAAQQFGDAALGEIEFNAEHARMLAMQIHQTRERAVWLSYLLTAGCAGLGTIGVGLLRRRTRAQLELADTETRHQQMRADELEQFAGRVAHDIRNPLSSAALALELIDRDLDEERHELALRLRRSLERADAITSDLLDFARAGAHPDPGARTDIREVIDGIADGLGLELDRRQIELHIEEVPPVLVACSRGVYLSMVGNLVRNAIKYMGERPLRRITIRVRDLGGRVRTEVHDTGPGVPRELQERLFEPYFRGQHAGSGLGLGLATVRRLADGHGGTVGVDSTIGVGSTFWFELPGS